MDPDVDDDGSPASRSESPSPRIPESPNPRIPESPNPRITASLTRLGSSLQPDHSDWVVHEQDLLDYFQPEWTESAPVLEFDANQYMELMNLEGDDQKILYEGQTAREGGLGTPGRLLTAGCMLGGPGGKPATCARAVCARARMRPTTRGRLGASSKCAKTASWSSSTLVAPSSCNGYVRRDTRPGRASPPPNREFRVSGSAGDIDPTRAPAARPRAHPRHRRGKCCPAGALPSRRIPESAANTAAACLAPKRPPSPLRVKRLHTVVYRKAERKERGWEGATGPNGPHQTAVLSWPEKREMATENNVNSTRACCAWRPRAPWPASPPPARPGGPCRPARRAARS